MDRIFTNKNINYNNFKNLANNKLYQIDYMQLYLKKVNDIAYIYSYNTCIIELDLKNKIFYNNVNKYSVTTSKQKNKILRCLDLWDYEKINVQPKHTTYGWITNLTLANLHDFANYYDLFWGV